MAVATETQAGLVRVCVAGITEGAVVVMETCSFAKFIREAAAVRFRVRAWHTVKICVAQQAGRIVALGAVAGLATLDVAFGQLCVQTAASANDTRDGAPVRVGMPERLAGNIHAFGFVTVLAETSGFMAGGALLRPAFRLQTMRFSEIQLMNACKNQAPRTARYGREEGRLDIRIRGARCYQERCAFVTFRTVVLDMAGSACLLVHTSDVFVRHQKISAMIHRA